MGGAGMGGRGMGGGMSGTGTAVGSGMMGFTIDGKSFDPARVDTAVAAGAIEEWTFSDRQPDGPSLPSSRVAHADHRTSRPTDR